MLSLSQLRRNLFSIFILMQDTGMTFEVAYRGVVYELDVRRTDKKPALTRPRIAKPARIHSIATDVCQECGAISFNGVCMNRNCVTVSNVA